MTESVAESWYSSSPMPRSGIPKDIAVDIYLNPHLQIRIIEDDTDDSYGFIFFRSEDSSCSSPLLSRGGYESAYEAVRAVEGLLESVRRDVIENHLTDYWGIRTARTLNSATIQAIVDDLEEFGIVDTEVISVTVQ